MVLQYQMAHLFQMVLQFQMAHLVQMVGQASLWMQRVVVVVVVVAAICGFLMSVQDMRVHYKQMSKENQQMLNVGQN